MTKYLEKISQDFIDKKLSRREFLRSAVTAGVATSTAYGLLKLLEAPEAHAQLLTTFALGEESGVRADEERGFDELILNPEIVPSAGPVTTQQFGEESGFIGNGGAPTTWWRGEDNIGTLPGHQQGPELANPTTLALGEEDSTGGSSFGFGSRGFSGTFNNGFGGGFGENFWSRFNNND